MLKKIGLTLKQIAMTIALTISIIISSIGMFIIMIMQLIYNKKMK